MSRLLFWEFDPLGVSATAGLALSVGTSLVASETMIGTGALTDIHSKSLSAQENFNGSIGITDTHSKSATASELIAASVANSYLHSKSSVGSENIPASGAISWSDSLAAVASELVSGSAGLDYLVSLYGQQGALIIAAMAYQMAIAASGVEAIPASGNIDNGQSINATAKESFFALASLVYLHALRSGTNPFEAARHVLKVLAENRIIAVEPNDRMIAVPSENRVVKVSKIGSLN